MQRPKAHIVERPPRHLNDVELHVVEALLAIAIPVVSQLLLTDGGLLVEVVELTLVVLFEAPPGVWLPLE